MRGSHGNAASGHDALGRPTQASFAQRIRLPLRKKLLERHARPDRQMTLPSLGGPRARREQIDQPDFVRVLDDGVGNCHFTLWWVICTTDVVQALDMLDVERRENVDAGIDNSSTSW